MAFSINKPIGTNWRADPNDIVNTKRALAQLGHYNVPADRGIDDWADSAMFDGIRSFQKANGLKVDAFMRPDGPTERAMSSSLGEGEISEGTYNGPRQPGENTPVIVPPPTGSRMPVFKDHPYKHPAHPYYDKKSRSPIIDGIDPRTGHKIPPSKAPY